MRTDEYSYLLKMAQDRGAEIGKRLAIEALRKPLYQAVGSHLAGREIDLKVKKPVTAGSLGCMYNNGKGIPTIEIDPDLTDERSLWVFLHEVAHVVLHSPAMTKSQRLTTLKPGGYTPGPMNQNDENDANILAREWWAYSEDHLYRYPGKSKTTRQLLALRDK